MVVLWPMSSYVGLYQATLVGKVDCQGPFWINHGTWAGKCLTTRWFFRNTLVRISRAKEKTVPVPISRAYMRDIQYWPEFGPVHKKAEKLKRDPAVRAGMPTRPGNHPKYPGRPLWFLRRLLLGSSRQDIPYSDYEFSIWLGLISGLLNS